MVNTLRNAVKVKDIRDRILFTFLMLIIIRSGSELPAPGVDGEVFKQWWASQSADGLGSVSYTHLDVYKRQIYTFQKKYDWF